MPVAEANVRTKSVYDPPGPEDGRRVLVTQYWPRGISRNLVDEYVRTLGPTRPLLHAFKSSEIDWPRFEAEYLEEMRKEDSRGEISRLAQLAKSETITLMCVCKDERQCHRSLLKQLVLDAMEPRH